MGVVRQTLWKAALAVAGLCAIGWVQIARAEDNAPGNRKIAEIRQTLKQIQDDQEKDRLLIERLMRRLDQVESETSQLKASNRRIKTETTQTSAEIETLKAQIDQGPSAKGFATEVHNFLGSHQFTIAGAAGGNFVFDQQSSSIDSPPHASQNSFFFNWEPLYPVPTEINENGRMKGLSAMVRNESRLSLSDALSTFGRAASPRYRPEICLDRQ